LPCWPDGERIASIGCGATDWRPRAAHHQPQASLWEAVLPGEALGLPAELTTVDRLLDDPVFIQPFRAHFDPVAGRPSIPIETYLRLMFLKHRYGLGYELLCGEVADSISWQRFCRIPLGGRVPHATTLVKLTRRVGEQAVAGLNQALLARAAEQKLLRTHKVRADTTVVAANVAYPTDLGLLARAVDKLATTIRRVQAAGVPATFGPGTAVARHAAAPTRSPGRCGRALARPSRSWSRSPGRSPGWPRRSWPTPAGS
jgi:IS5 family transposase